MRKKKSKLALSSSEMAAVTCFRGVRQVEAARSMTHRWIVGRSEDGFTRAAQARAGLHTAAQVQRYLERMRKSFVEKLGGFPERTPLRARTLGVLRRQTHTVEKVVFESYPGFLVSANLYLPVQKSKPVPGVLLAMGHLDDAKASAEYQKVCLALVLNGFAVLGFDPVGEGERFQFPDRRGFKSRLRWCVNEHATLSWRSELLGRSLASIMIWDGIRALDYLAGRVEVDPRRLAITGNSGGGTQTTFISAIDRRLAASIPNCYITDRRTVARPESIRFDPEQIQDGVIRDGLDHAELLGLIAPAALLVQSGLQDLGFHPAGTRRSFRTAKQWFALMGMEDRIALQQEDVGHGYFRVFREGTVRWLTQRLKGKDIEFSEPRLHAEDRRDLWCTRTGNVMELGSRTVLDLLRDEYKAVRRQRQTKLAAGRRSDMAHRLVAGLRLDRTALEQRRVKSRPCGQGWWGDYRVERHLVHSDPGIVLPTAILRPRGKESRGAVLAVSDKGKGWECAHNPLIRTWLEEGRTVVLADLRGWGETRQIKNIWTTRTPHWCYTIGQEGFLQQGALQLGDSLMACRVRDLGALANFARGKLKLEMDDCRLFARGMAAWSAAVLCHYLPFAGLAVVDFLASYDEVLASEVPVIEPGYVVHGALNYFDLPEVLAALNPMPLWISRPLTAEGRGLSKQKYRDFIGPIQTAYARSSAPANMREQQRPFPVAPRTTGVA